MPEDGYSVELDVLPLLTGFLPLPRVKLVKYQGKKNNNATGMFQKKKTNLILSFWIDRPAHTV